MERLETLSLSETILGLTLWERSSVKNASLAHSLTKLSGATLQRLGCPYLTSQIAVEAPPRGWHFLEQSFLEQVGLRVRFAVVC